MPDHIRALRAPLTGALLALLLAGAVTAAGESIPRGALSAGGGSLAGPTLSLRASVGQPVAGAVGGDLRLCSGLVCGPAAPAPAPPDAPLFLPLLAR